MALKYIADKSALARVKHATVAARLAPILGQIATCSIVDLEVLFSARTHAELAATLRERRGFPRVDIDQSDFDRAVHVIERLGRVGHHRAASIPDLIIAAVAERHQLTVLHYDKDFEVIARVTGQSVEWVVPAGTVA